MILQLVVGTFGAQPVVERFGDTHMHGASRERYTVVVQAVFDAEAYNESVVILGRHALLAELICP